MAYLPRWRGISPSVIEFYKKTQGWEEQEIRQQILKVYNVSDVSNFSALDVKSIMMYVDNAIERMFF